MSNNNVSIMNEINSGKINKTNNDDVSKLLIGN